MKTNKGKIAFICLGIIGVVGLGVASAVNLGIEANNELGAGTSVTATCQPAGSGNDIVVGFSDPIYVAASQTFQVNQIALSNIATECLTLTYDVVVADTSGVALGTATGVISAATQTVTLPSAVDSADIGSVSLVVYEG